MLANPNQGILKATKTFDCPDGRIVEGTYFTYHGVTEESKLHFLRDEYVKWFMTDEEFENNFEWINADEERHAKLKEIPIWEDVTLDDYWIAPSGLGPLAYEWSDKPHRLLYQLINHIEDLYDLKNVMQSAKPLSAEMVKSGRICIDFWGREWMALGDKWSTVEDYPTCQKYIMIEVVP